MKHTFARLASGPWWLFLFVPAALAEAAALVPLPGACVRHHTGRARRVRDSADAHAGPRRRRDHRRSDPGRGHPHCRDDGNAGGGQLYGLHIDRDADVSTGPGARGRLLRPVDPYGFAGSGQQPGRLRSQQRKATACVRLAGVSIRPESSEGSPLALVHPPHCATGTQASLCNQHLPPLKGPPMPVGRFILIADFVLDTTASGVCNAHAVADFSPDTTLPAEWVRMRDPFQGASKKSFGFTFSVAAAPASAAGAGDRPGFWPRLLAR